MTPREYLQKVIESQKLTEDSDELNSLREHRDTIEGHLRDAFGASPTIRYGGSHAKGTLVKASYDLDIVCYFPRDDRDAGDTLEQIYNNTKDTLSAQYFVEPKTSALRVKGQDRVDFHIDVVPGRFIDEEKEDAFLYQATGEKHRLKTNIKTHIAHVKESGVTDAIRLAKVWRARHGVQVRTFALDLLVIDVLGGSSDALDEQMVTLFEQLRDEPGTIVVEDPANPTGNDLSGIWNDTVRAGLSARATDALAAIERSGWQTVFGPVAEDRAAATVVERLRQAGSASYPARPWGR